MSKNNRLINTKNCPPEWVTIREAIEIANRTSNHKIKDCDIYRHALYGTICLSIYFQSSIALRKVQTSNKKIKVTPLEKSFLNRLCFLHKQCFINDRNLIVSTIGEFKLPRNKIIDTHLEGFEYILLQQLLAFSLGIPQPSPGINDINYGISVSLSGETFQLFEKIILKERIKQQIMKLPKDVAPDVNQTLSKSYIKNYNECAFFPIHELPKDACFVIRHDELEKLINLSVKRNEISSPSTRISTPLSRLLWLSCKHNEEISPLIRQPYKLLSIFEQWAIADGITDRLSGDTLKTALERGSPIYTHISK
ncbi:hypothetical protein AB4K05_18740 [Kluyvera sp. STS39-E]|uniref:hypothetical protein n=1 Tax=Enterobacteriaceae TaxID=543 RepID=UPI000E3C7F00|nr:MULTISPECIES: hypothetical protein [Citrobacter]MBD0826638.1 hypothetical protein [Citrobacter sp. C1]RFU93357.1 hypothetical protein DZA29_02375 [Citrobacter gillenii]